MLQISFKHDGLILQVTEMAFEDAHGSAFWRIAWRIDRPGEIRWNVITDLALWNARDGLQMPAHKLDCLTSEQHEAIERELEIENAGPCPEGNERRQMGITY